MGKSFKSDEEREIGRLGGRIKDLQSTLKCKNRELDALHRVWCSGGCEGGVHRHIEDELTAEMVAFAEYNTRRLRQWYVNKAGRDQYGSGGFEGDSVGLHRAWASAYWDLVKAYWACWRNRTADLIAEQRGRRR